MTAAGFVALAGAYFGWQSYQRHRDLSWLSETAVPQITALLQHPGGGLFRLLGDLHRRAHRPAGVVFVRLRIAEGEQDAVGHDPRNMAATATSELAEDRMLRMQERVQFLQRGDFGDGEGRQVERVSAGQYL